MQQIHNQVKPLLLNKASHFSRQWASKQTTIWPWQWNDCQAWLWWTSTRKNLLSTILWLSFLWKDTPEECFLFILFLKKTKIIEKKIKYSVFALFLCSFVIFLCKKNDTFTLKKEISKHAAFASGWRKSHFPRLESCLWRPLFIKPPLLKTWICPRALMRYISSFQKNVKKTWKISFALNFGHISRKKR